MKNSTRSTVFLVFGTIMCFALFLTVVQSSAFSETASSFQAVSDQEAEKLVGGACLKWEESSEGRCLGSDGSICFPPTFWKKTRAYIYLRYDDNARRFCGDNVKRCGWVNARKGTLCWKSGGTVGDEPDPDPEDDGSDGIEYEGDDGDGLG